MAHLPFSCVPGGHTLCRINLLGCNLVVISSIKIVRIYKEALDMGMYLDKRP